jgi:hypothetical protein
MHGSVHKTDNDGFGLGASVPTNGAEAAFED